MSLTGKIVGYDPGGNGNHGVATLMVDEGRPIQLSFATVRSAQAAFDWLTIGDIPSAAGIDTLTVLSTGDSGWRPADRWLRGQYPQVQNSVVNPNYLQGAMALNGLAVMISLRGASEDIVVSETHPKVLYHRLSGFQYGYQVNRVRMNELLGQWIGLAVRTTCDHEWDAVISCFAVLQGITGRWVTDLHQLPAVPGEKLVQPGGPSHYYWP